MSRTWISSGATAGADAFGASSPPGTTWNETGTDRKGSRAVPAESLDLLVSWLRSDFVGGHPALSDSTPSGASIPGPFGMRPLVYADSTATGRFLSSFEDYLKTQVMPMFANTHSSGSACGIQTTLYFQEARELVREAVHGSDNDVVLFSGNGCTGAIDKFARILGLPLGSATASSNKKTFTCRFPTCTREFPNEGALKLHARTHLDGDRTYFSGKNSVTTETEVKEPGTANGSSSEQYTHVVLVGPMEHHSNILPWREASCCKVVHIKPSSSGTLCLDDLKVQLEAHKHFKTKIASFAAASNVTGLVEKVDIVTKLVHEYNFLSCWDYAAAGPHMPLDMNPPGCEKEGTAKDVVFLSPHKFPGGPGAPGVLVIKKRLLTNAVPSVPGGGTVFYVTEDAHRYLENLEEREEGGTPNVIGSIRCGMVFQLWDAFGPKEIALREESITCKVLKAWKTLTNLKLLGVSETTGTQRIPIISFMIEYNNTGRYLHWNFVSTLLSDLFGIQCRGGCLCAGPYGHALLNISSTAANLIQDELLEKNELLRPGFVRISFSYYMSAEEVDYIISAVRFVAVHGWKFLPKYMFWTETGEWRHRTIGCKTPFRKWLGSISYKTGRMTFPTTPSTTTSPESNSVPSAVEIMKTAERLAEEALKEMTKNHKPIVDQTQLMTKRVQDCGLRWFVLPSEVVLSAASVSSSANEVRKHNVQVGSMELLAHFQPILSQLNAEASTTTHSLRNKSTDTEANRDEPASKRTRLDNVIPPSTSIVAQEGGACEGMTCSLGSAFRSSCMDDEDLDTTTDTKETEQDTIMDEVIETTTKTAETKAESTPSSVSKKSNLWPKVPKHLLSLTGKAIKDYNMIKDGDRVLIGLSGGKDSLCMLHVLRTLQRKAPIKFDIGCVTMDPQFPGFDPSPLIPYLKSLDIPYFFESQSLMGQAQASNPRSICAWCSRMKRGILYSCARREKYNVLVLAQHLDDLAESFVMSAFHNGRLRTMKANYVIQAEDIRVIRPFVYVREHMTRQFSKTANLPIVDENCPACFEGPKERYRIKTLLAQQEHLMPQLFPNLLKTMKPLMAADIDGKLKPLNEND
eukprot:m.82303 g.82303  ORF g.82303 m.82303 type:complete len:1086 (+) comp12863_c0_seq3:256-3513(+)